jgi:hypothetical protein
VDERRGAGGKIVLLGLERITSVHGEARGRNLGQVVVWLRQLGLLLALSKDGLKA